MNHGQTRSILFHIFYSISQVLFLFAGPVMRTSKVTRGLMTKKTPPFNSKNQGNVGPLAVKLNGATF